MPDSTAGDYWVVLTNGDSAEADDLDAAVLAAATMIRDAQQNGTYYTRVTAAIYCDGFLLRDGLTLADMTLAAVA